MESCTLKEIAPSGHGFEEYFTENDERMQALWRISRVRQLRPEVMERMRRSDLLFLAGQDAEGYGEGESRDGEAVRNKIVQNAERARIELNSRAARTTWWITIVGVVVGAVLGAALTVLVG